MILPTPPEPLEIKLSLLGMPPRDRARMACLPGGVPSYLWSRWKTALRGCVTWQEFQTKVRRSRYDFAKWVEGTTNWSAVCQSLAASIS